MLYVVIGPPASGKSTWCRQQAKPGDLIIDYDRIAQAFTTTEADPHDHTPEVKAVAKAARQAAIDKALTLTGVDVYLIHSTPSRTLLDHYRTLGAEIITIDPGRDTVMARIKAERPWQMQQAAKKWYDQQTEPPRSAPNRAKPKKTTQERGYGWEHRKRREALRPVVEAGKATCWRCTQPISPHEPWDLGHDDTDRTKYRGPEHVSCNRTAGGRASGESRKSSGPPPRSRDW